MQFVHGWTQRFETFGRRASSTFYIPLLKKKNSKLLNIVRSAFTPFSYVGVFFNTLYNRNSKQFRENWLRKSVTQCRAVSSHVIRLVLGPPSILIPWLRDEPWTSAVSPIPFSLPSCLWDDRGSLFETCRVSSAGAGSAERKCRVPGRSRSGRHCCPARSCNPCPRPEVTFVSHF